jgi:hypothetical protein
MADELDQAGTGVPGVEAQPPQAGTPADDTLVTTLKSRAAGLDAKVTELQKTIAAADDARKAAEARLAEYETGKANESEAARAQIERLNAELANTRKAAQVADLRAQYPESYSVYGEAIAGIPADVLAAGEARLRGVPEESHTPPPVGNNQMRSQAPATKTIEEMSLEELKAHGGSAFAGLTWEAITKSD